MRKYLLFELACATTLKRDFTLTCHTNFFSREKLKSYQSFCLIVLLDPRGREDNDLLGLLENIE